MHRASPSVEDPIPDWQDVVQDKSFHGVCWMPTVLLRFVEREVVEALTPHEEPDIYTEKILQQMWETGIVNNTGHMQHVLNPNKHMWRDVPVQDEAQELWPELEPSQSQ